MDLSREYHAAATNLKTTKQTNEKQNDADLSRLHNVVCQGTLEEIQDLTKHRDGKLVFYRDEDQNTPLHTVCLVDHDSATEIAKILLGVQESDEYPYTFKVKRKELLSWQNNEGLTPLHLAARNQNNDLVQFLLRLGSDHNAIDKNNNTPLHLAVEGDTDNAIECVRAILNCDPTRRILNMVNNENQTPLHKAINKKFVKMVKFLLGIEKGCNLGFKDKLWRTTLHYACAGPGENKDSVAIVKELLLKCKKHQINMQDITGKTALHIASIQRLPMITKALVEHKDTDVLHTDELQRTALHYAADNGCYPKGYQCVEVLIARKFNDKNESINYLFENKDKDDYTPFMIACIKCPMKTMEKYITAASKLQHWLNDKNIAMIYEYCPLGVKALMDGAFCEVEQALMEDESEDVLLVDYGPITGYIDPVNTLHQETKYLVEAVTWKFELQKEIILHPLVQLFLMKKWTRLRPLIVTWIAWLLLWLVSYGVLVCSTYTNGYSSSNTVRGVIAASLMSIHIIASIVNENFEIYNFGLGYFKRATNYLQIIQIVLSLIAVIPAFNGTHPEKWQKYTTATGVLLAYTLCMKDIAKLQDKIGLVIEVLKQVHIQILQVLLCCSPLITGFTLAFKLIFEQHTSLNSIFPKPIVKILVMMTGEIDFEETFNQELDHANGFGNGTRYRMENEEGLPYRVIHLIFFMAFLICVPVGIYNVLTGFAMDKVMELQDRAKVGQLAKQLEHIFYIESILLGLSPLGIMLNREQYTYWISYMNVTTIKIENKLLFTTVFREKLKKDVGHLRDDFSIWNCICFGGKRTIESCFKPKLSAEVIEQIYTLGSSITEKNNNEELQTKPSVDPK